MSCVGFNTVAYSLQTEVVETGEGQLVEEKDPEVIGNIQQMGNLFVHGDAFPYTSLLRVSCLLTTFFVV